MRRAFVVGLVCFAAACGGGTTPPGDGGGTDLAATDSGGHDAGSVCTSAAVCDDGVFCNGAERCAPGAAGADSRGCASASSPCAAGQTCDEATRTCVTPCTGSGGDADSDGHRAMSCGGDDCDDADPSRYPGNMEVCDAANRDEDCDPATFGFRDLDGDGSPDFRCCNTSGTGTMTCGTDCNDAAPTTHPAAPEVCDLVDNDCDGMTDEGVLHTYWTDADGDGYGSVADTTGTTACFLPSGYSELHTDCDDASMGIHPGAPEVCDTTVPAVDENCDGTANPASLCMCTGTAARPCTLPGACAAGVEMCSAGAWGMCSIAPSVEICNGIDDNCDGSVDESLRVLCYADADNDGYAATAAATATQCPQPGRESVGGCPAAYTNRAPSGTDIDCNDGASTIHPGAMEICIDGAPPADENCNGTADEGVGVDCFADMDDDTFAPASSSVQHKCIDISRAAVGGCPFRFTDRPPSGAGVDCDDTHATAHPGGIEICDAAMIDEDCDGTANPPAMCACTNGSTRPCPDPGVCGGGTQMCMAGAWGTCSVTPVAEICNGLDDDCNGAIDNGVLTACYADGDMDGYAVASATVRYTCTGCTTTETTTPPTGANVDCDGALATVHPGATELCDRLDNDCSAGGGAEVSEDFDNDGYANLGITTCAGGPLPATDCQDVSSDVHPGQGAYFTVGYCPACDYGGIYGCAQCGRMTIPVALSFDYNCSGGAELQPASGSCGGGVSCLGGCGISGFTYSGTPACGSAAAYNTCFCQSGVPRFCSSTASTMLVGCH